LPCHFPIATDAERETNILLNDDALKEGLDAQMKKARNFKI
jgi:hypothetical protein